MQNSRQPNGVIKHELNSVRQVNGILTANRATFTKANRLGSQSHYIRAITAKLSKPPNTDSA